MRMAPPPQKNNQEAAVVEFPAVRTEARTGDGSSFLPRDRRWRQGHRSFSPFSWGLSPKASRDGGFFIHF